MLRNTIKKIGVLSLIAAPFHASAIAYDAFNGEFVVGFGPLTLGHATMLAKCEKQNCNYETNAKGSFMWIKADLKERGSYIRNGDLLVPVQTSYKQKVGSKKKAYDWDFSQKQFVNGKNNKKEEFEKDAEGAYPYVPLLYQITLDLKNGGPKEQYDYLSKQRAKQVHIRGYKKTQIEEGTLHFFVAKGKEDEMECFFLQKGDNIWLEKLKYGSFKLLRKNGVLPKNIK
ncbi:hypothetical protein L3Q72_08890 [Vibrio sp. JC009]|uniref:hypothetical protein n=1 Tax=Vibrio sp. JC009 TaxID=2912314 RepID=UPI0023AF599A|nr:hypothetical protein [Vibrio sp. JC009]WED20759.1 hypothetical protein L3Q72_08890 [Vibrio sp. JC009]